MERVYSKSEMKVLEAIFNRRSIRKFLNKSISSQDIETILHAGFCAPSAHNKRPWHFVVVKDKEKLEAFSQLNPYTKMFALADTAIAVCADEKRQEVRDYLYEDSAAAIQNILLAVHALGLGAVWCGMKKDSEYYHNLAKLCKLPEGIIPIGLIAIGYPEEEKKSRDRFEEEKVHYEVWSDKE